MNKKKKKNKYLPLIVLLAFIVVMAAAYSALSKSNDKKEAEKAAEEAASNAVEMIAEYDSSTAVSLSYTRRGEETIAFEVSSGEWVLCSDTNFPLDQSIVSSMASAISSIGIKNHIDTGDPSEYGLEEPAYTIEVAYENGDAHKYRIGDYNSFGGGAYYFMMDGSMYTISGGLSSYFDYTLDDLLVLEDMPTDIDEEYINSITVTWDGEENVIEDTDGISALFDLFGDIRLNDCADYYTTEDERAEYGLDGTRKISISYKRAVTSTDADGNENTSRLDTSYTFLFGNATDGDSYYGSPEKSTIAYGIDSDTVNSVVEYLTYEAAEVVEDEEP